MWDEVPSGCFSCCIGGWENVFRGNPRLKLEKARKAGKKFLAPVPTVVGGLTIMLKVLPLYFSKPKDAAPVGALGPFRTEAARLEQAPASGLRVTWFGHSGMLVEIDGARVLVDPVWDERASPWTWAGPRRFFAPTMELEALPALDAVLISHDHYDHLGEATVRKLARLMPEVRWITSLGVGTSLVRFGVRRDRITELDWTENTVLGAGLTLTSVPARHFSGRGVTNRNETLWAAFVLRGERHTVFYGADTGVWPGLATIGREYGPFDLTMLEIGAFNELWKDIHLGPDGAVEAFEMAGGGVLMPIHWGLFDLALHGWREPIERLREVAAGRGIRLFSPEPGMPTEVEKGIAVVSDWWRH